MVVLNISDGMGSGLGQTGPQTWFVGVSDVDLLTHRRLFLKVISSYSFIDNGTILLSFLKIRIYIIPNTHYIYIIYVYINIYTYMIHIPLFDLTPFRS